MATKTKAAGAADDKGLEGLDGITPQQAAVACKLLGKAADRIAKAAGRATLEPGGYHGDLHVEIAGDLTVDQPGEPGHRVSVSAADVALAALGKLAKAERASAISAALKDLAKARGDDQSPAARRYAGAKLDCDQAIERDAMTLGLVEETPGRAGAVRGTPRVTLRGVVAGNDVHATVEAA